jgi:hypothetical protein
MKIKIGSKISANRFREGTIVDINIATSTNDVAGELGVSAKEYDTELGYVGSVSYKTDEGNNYWCYFHQISGVEND